MMGRLDLCRDARERVSNWNVAYALGRLNESVGVRHHGQRFAENSHACHRDSMAACFRFHYQLPAYEVYYEIQLTLKWLLDDPIHGFSSEKRALACLCSSQALVRINSGKIIARNMSLRRSKNDDQKL